MPTAFQSCGRAKKQTAKRAHIHNVRRPYKQTNKHKTTGHADDTRAYKETYIKIDIYLDGQENIPEEIETNRDRHVESSK
jgi:beta-galactosidase beta subunit